VSRSRTREATSLELALWRHMVHDVQPLGGTRAELLESTAPPAAEASLPTATKAPGDPEQPSPPSRLPTPAPMPGPSNVDRRTWQRLQRGQYPISARLDLHGMTQAQAHARLIEFLSSQQARGARCVLVITGRGIRSGGVLRSETPRWLATPPLAARVLAWASARMGHGGDGAIYVLLRRSRD
jgi:DNA-nicking Smr family endonuclease